MRSLHSIARLRVENSSALYQKNKIEGEIVKKQLEATVQEKRSLDAYIKLMRSTESVNRRIDQQKPLPASLTSSQFAVLEALLFHGPLKQAEISRKILKTPGNLTLVIENLVKAGLTERTFLADDRRVKIIKLTEKGRVLIETVFPNMKTAISRSFSVLTQNELQELSRLLKKLGTSEPG